MGLKLGELIILLLIVVIFFGSKRLPSLGGALGEAIRNFKKGIGGDSDAKEQAKLEQKPNHPTNDSKPDKTGPA